jgi:lysophospholipase L1-like esterase
VNLCELSCVVFEEDALLQSQSGHDKRERLPQGTRFFSFVFLTGIILALMLAVITELVLRLSGIGSPPPPLNPLIFRPDPSLGVVLKTDWSGVFAGGEVSTNSMGIRGPAIPSLKGAQRRILLVGDSFVFGYGLREEETLRAHLGTSLKKIFPATETCVINAGVPGYNLVQDVSWTLKIGLSLEPDWIILAIVPNDLEPPLWLDKHTQPDPGDAKSWLDWIGGDPRVFEIPGAKRFNVLNLTQRLAKVILPGQRSLAQDYFRFCNEVLFSSTAWPQAQASLLRMKTTAQSNHIPLTVVLFPVPVRLKSDPFGPFNEKIVSFCQESSIQVLDPAEEWADVPETRLRWHPDDLHPSGYAHQLMAEYLIRHQPHMPLQ